MKKFSYLLVLILTAGFFSCGSLPNLLQVKEPEVSLRSVDLTGISLKGVDMLLHLDVENPNGITIPLPKIDWELFINEAPFISGAVNNNKSLAARQMVTLDLPLNVSYEGLYNTIASVVSANEASYRIDIAVTFNIPLLGERVYRFTHSGKLPLVKVPEVSFKGITRKSLGTTMEFVLTWEVDNKNIFDFGLEEFGYDFTVNNSRWAAGNIENPPAVKAKSKTAIPLTVSISAANVVKELVTVLSRGSAVNYNCTGNMQFQGALPGMEKIELPLDLKGSTQIR